MSEGETTEHSVNVPLRQRRELYRLIISQLLHDGHEDIGKKLCEKEEIVGVLPNDELLQTVVTSLPSSTETQSTFGETDGAMLLNSGIDSASTAVEYEEVAELKQTANCTAVCISNNGGLLAVGAADGITRIYDLEKLCSGDSRGGDARDGILCVIPSEAFAPVTTVAFNNSSHLVAVGFQSGEFRVYNIRTGSPRLETAQEDYYKVESINFHPSDTFVIVATSHVNVRLYQTQTWACYTTTSSTPHNAPLTQARYNHSASKFATSDLSGTVKLWDSVSSVCTHTYADLFEGAPCTSIEFSSSDEYLLVGTTVGASLLLNVENGVKVAHYHPHISVSSTCPVLFGVDENSVVGYAGIGGELQLWHTSSGEKLHTVLAHQSPLEHIAVNRKKHILVTTARNSKALCWVLSSLTETDKEEQPVSSSANKEEGSAEEQEQPQQEQSHAEQEKDEEKSGEEKAHSSGSNNMDEGKDESK
eukprot:m.5068 g.5068  ORF g.5068 m.5068 type:complete len:475 (+) comp4122_c0_seq1:81-1505(+)